MTYNFCTFFDRNFLFRGLALHRSLVRHGGDFKLWILCIDTITYQTLKKLRLEHVELIAFEDFEDEKLRKAKSDRTPIEYIWSCGSSLPRYVLNTNPNLENITFVDADTYFYASPEPIFQALSGHSIIISPHRYSPDLAYLEKTSGIFNVGVLVFRNDANARECLEWWRDRVIEWCHAYYDNGRYGDQLYLNDWPTRFKGVQVLTHKGINAAPWNIAQYAVTKKNDQILIDGEPLICYHFHALTIYTDQSFKPHKRFYDISRVKQNIIYTPYLNELKTSIKAVLAIDPGFNHGLQAKPAVAQRLHQWLIASIHLPLKKILPRYNQWYKLLKIWASKK